MKILLGTGMVIAAVVVIGIRSCGFHRAVPDRGIVIHGK